MSKSKKKAEKTAAAPAKAAGLRVPLDGQYIGKLAGILLAITAVTALLLGAVNYVTAPVIAAATEEKRVAAMQQVLTAEEYTAVEAFPAEGETYSSAAGSATVTALSQAVHVKLRPSRIGTKGGYHKLPRPHPSSSHIFSIRPSAKASCSSLIGPLFCRS